MSADIKAFPGIADATKARDEQPDAAVIAFCEDLVARAKSGQIQGIAVALVKPGRTTADGWRRADGGSDCCHELMASITYLQLRYAAQINATATRDASKE